MEAVAEFAEASEIEESINKSFEDDVEYQRAELVEEGLLWATVIIEVSDLPVVSFSRPNRLTL